MALIMNKFIFYPLFLLMILIIPFVGNAQGTIQLSQVVIGKQVWMAENLNVDKFQNGDPIPQAKTNEEWTKANELQQPVWCYYNYNASNNEKYGKLYNWYAINDPRGVVPKGWKIPSNGDWTKLIDFLGGETSDIYKAFIAKGFAPQQSGYRDHEDGEFRYLTQSSYWWSGSDSPENDGMVYYRGLNPTDGTWSMWTSEGGGYSVRFIKR
jgi:uncharacterized protein (TIGR02145 family)